MDEIQNTFSQGEAEWRQLYEKIGHIVVMINTAHWCVFEMMGILLNTSRDDTTPIYYSLKADSAQRDLTLAIAADRLSLPSEEDLLKRLGKAINDLGTASGTRNAFIHTHWSMVHSSGQRSFTFEGKPHPKLDFADPVGQATRFTVTLDDIIGRLLALCDELETAPSVLALRERTGGRHR